MKKSFLMLGLAVAAMTSCTNDEVIDLNQSNQKAIGFESFVNKGTRATVTNEVKADNLNRFYVYGNDGETDIFDNVSVIKSGEKWVMQENKEKDWETKEYKFAAYADGVGVAEHVASGISTSFRDGVLSFDNYIISETQASQTDLIAATASRDNTSTLNVTAVGLDFKHLLSKVNFKFSNTNTNNLSMVVSNVTFTVYRQADCSYEGDGPAEWSAWETAQRYDIAQPCKGTSEDEIDLRIDENTTEKIKAKYLIARGEESGTSIEYFVIPGQANDANNTVGIISYTVAYYDANKNQVETYAQSLSLFPGSIAWQPSYIYNYDVDLPASPKKIEFSVNTIGSWEAQGVTLDGANQQL